MQAGIPEDVVESARCISEALDQEDEHMAAADPAHPAHAGMTALYALAHKMECVALQEPADAQALRKQLRQLKYELHALPATATRFA